MLRDGPRQFHSGPDFHFQVLACFPTEQVEVVVLERVEVFGAVERVVGLDFLEGHVNAHTFAIRADSVALGALRVAVVVVVQERLQDIFVPLQCHSGVVRDEHFVPGHRHDLEVLVFCDNGVIQVGEIQVPNVLALCREIEPTAALFVAFHGLSRLCVHDNAHNFAKALLLDGIKRVPGFTFGFLFRSESSLLRSVFGFQLRSILFGVFLDGADIDTRTVAVKAYSVRIVGIVGKIARPVALAALIRHFVVVRAVPVGSNVGPFEFHWCYPRLKWSSSLYTYNITKYLLIVNRYC